jgi:hypothetical protein
MRVLRRRAAHLGIALTTVLVATACLRVPLPGVSCPLFPDTSFWRADVAALPVHPRSGAWVSSVGATRGAHADFGSGLWDGGPIGIPYDVVPGTQPRVPVSFDYADESDPGPYPIPPIPSIEGGSSSSGDRHVIVVDKDACRLYETWSTYPDGNGGWNAGSGAVFDLNSNATRPAGWTSADAAGLPVLPGLVRYEEVSQDKVQHAIRITVPRSQRAYVWPARHQAGSTTDPNVPPMGAWFRVKASVDETRFDPLVRPIIRALKTYGGIVADNGAGWYLSGVPDERWDNDALRSLSGLVGDDWEAVDTSSLVVHPDSWQATTAR